MDDPRVPGDELEEHVESERGREPTCVRCGDRLPKPFEVSWTSYLVMEATALLLFVVLIVLEPAILWVCVAAIAFSQVWLFWEALGPKRCPRCGKWQRIQR